MNLQIVLLEQNAFHTVYIHMVSLQYGFLNVLFKLILLG